MAALYSGHYKQVLLVLCYNCRTAVNVRTGPFCDLGVEVPASTWAQLAGITLLLPAVPVSVAHV